MAYFRGGITNDKEYSNGTRLALRKLGRTDPHFFYIREGHSTSYWRELLKSQFALCPAGWAPWSPRLFDAVAAGAIPVIIADNWNPPFADDFLDYSRFSIRVPQAKVWMLKQILLAITQDEIKRLRAEMGKIYHYYVYSKKPFGQMDAIGAIQEILRKRLGDKNSARQQSDDEHDGYEINESFEGLELLDNRRIKVYL